MVASGQYYRDRGILHAYCRRADRSPSQSWGHRYYSHPYAMSLCLWLRLVRDELWDNSWWLTNLIKWKRTWGLDSVYYSPACLSCRGHYCAGNFIPVIHRCVSTTCHACVAGLDPQVKQLVRRHGSPCLYYVSYHILSDPFDWLLNEITEAASIYLFYFILFLFQHLFVYCYFICFVCLLDNLFIYSFTSLFIYLFIYLLIYFLDSLKSHTLYIYNHRT
jgi:hypothetical protein